ncbi:MAG: HAD family hydrolase [Deltaproteobacteria bacterium]|nr:HAD family hydrolase [Deltaproteobacteria bacterium]MBI3387836.1 HAD family hydrolase [Deltaproteobacteria bacterium]
MYRAILFDLYDTVVLFRKNVPTLQVAGTRWRSTMDWMREVVAQELPGVSHDEFLRAITETTAEIIRARPPEYREVPSPERFRRALLRLGAIGADVAGRAERFSLAHMRHLAASTETPAQHRTLLQRLTTRYPLALVSNFDHGPTARAILDRDALTPLFRAIAISDGFGRRKPHPSIFHEALRQLGVDASDALFVGDSLHDDVAGASAVGMDTVWLNPTGEPLPDGACAPTHTVAHLIELETVLG